VRVELVEKICKGKVSRITIFQASLGKFGQKSFPPPKILLQLGV